jgi:hypothetical protein
MVWGGKGANATWFSARPEHIHGINWLPIHAGSLYLGHYPAYVQKNYAALVKEKGSAKFDEWADIIWMYRALANADDALQLFEAGKDTIKFESGNSKVHTYYWIAALQQLGQVDPTVTADCPTFAVFRKGDKRVYCAWNMSASPRTVTFSDGATLQVEPGKLATRRVDK